MKSYHPFELSPKKNPISFHHKNSSPRRKSSKNFFKVLLTCENVKKMQMKKEIQFIFDENDRRQSMLMMMREEVFWSKKNRKVRKNPEIDSLAIV